MGDHNDDWDDLWGGSSDTGSKGWVTRTPFPSTRLAEERRKPTPPVAEFLADDDEEDETDDVTEILSAARLKHAVRKRKVAEDDYDPGLWGEAETTDAKGWVDSRPLPTTRLPEEEPPPPKPKKAPPPPLPPVAQVSDDLTVPRAAPPPRVVPRPDQEATVPRAVPQAPPPAEGRQDRLLVGGVVALSLGACLAFGLAVLSQLTPGSIATSEGRGDIDLLEAEDDLDVVLTRKASDTWLAEAHPNDPALTMLATLATTGQPPPGGSGDVDALIAGLVADRRAPTTDEILRLAAAGRLPSERDVASLVIEGSIPSRKIIAAGVADGRLPGDVYVARLAAEGRVPTRGDVVRLVATGRLDTQPSKPEEDGWVGGVVSTISSVASAVVGTEEQGLKPVAMANADWGTPSERSGFSGSATFSNDQMRFASSEGTGDVDLLAGEEGLDIPLRRGPKDGWLSEADPDDPALAMLETIARSGQGQAGGTADIDTLVAELASEGRGPTASEIVRLAASGRLPTEADVVNPTSDDVLARLAAEGKVPTQSDLVRLASTGQLDPAAKAPEDDSWLGSMMSTMSAMVGTSEERSEFSGSATFSTDQMRFASSEGSGQVDLLAGDDGLDVALRRGPKDGWLSEADPDDPALAMLAMLGKNGQASAGGTADVDALIAELASEGRGPTASEIVQLAASGRLPTEADLVNRASDDLLAHLAAEGKVPTQSDLVRLASTGQLAPAAKQPEDDSWLGSMMSTMSSVASAMMGTPEEAPKPVAIASATPPAAAVAAAPAKPAPVASARAQFSGSATFSTDQMRFASSEGSGQIDLLAGDDGLDVSLARGPKDGWLTDADPDDPALAMLAMLAAGGQAPAAGTSDVDALIAELASEGRGPTASEIAQLASSDRLPTEADVVARAGDDLLAQLAAEGKVPTKDDLVRLASTGRLSSGTAAEGPVDLLAGDDGLGTVSARLSTSGATDPWLAEASADDPAMQLLAEIDGTAKPSTLEPIDALAAAWAARDKEPCRAGELCDQTLATWRDDGTATDLLAQEEELAWVTGARTNVADLFYVPGQDDGPDEAMVAEVESLNTLVVRISVQEGYGVPIRIDGQDAGSAPTVVEVAPGWHEVEVGAGEMASSLRLFAGSDPDAWCFAERGRGYKDVRCAQ